MKKKPFILAAVVTLILAAAALVLLNLPCDLGRDAVPYRELFTVENTYPHSTDSFTEGLSFYHGQLYESTGLYGESMLMKNIDLNTGAYEDAVSFDKRVFGEGSVVYRDKLYMLTYKQNTAFVYDPNSLELLEELPYSREGWGLTTDGNDLIAGDGSSHLYFMDEQLKDLKKLTVKLSGRKVKNINELEYFDGLIWANIWGENYIIAINAKTGNVEKVLDFSQLLPDEAGGDNVLNGIAWNGGKLYITGKRWSVLYELSQN